MLFEQDVSVSQVFNILVSALQLLLQLAQPLLHVSQALVEELRAVGIKQQPSLLLGGGLQFVPQLVELGQTLLHYGLELRLGLHELLTLLKARKRQKKKKSWFSICSFGYCISVLTVNAVICWFMS